MWFNSDLTDKKKEMRRREKIWYKHKCSIFWNDYKKARQEYHCALSKQKWIFFKNKISESKGNMKELYKIVNNILGHKKENPLPPGHSDKEQAELFADFFINKIQSIHDDLDVYNKYEVQERESGVKLANFQMLDSEEIWKIVMKLKTKSCELDVILTTYIKKNKEQFVGLLTKIVNMSLDLGFFSQKWKTAILCPLTKKLNGDLV